MFFCRKFEDYIPFGYLETELNTTDGTFPQRSLHICVCMHSFKRYHINIFALQRCSKMTELLSLKLCPFTLSSCVDAMAMFMSPFHKGDSFK